MRKINLIYADAFGRFTRVDVKRPAVVGRSRFAQLKITDPSVSRYHCLLFPETIRRSQPLDAMAWHLRDLGSENGTYLNRRRVSGTVKLTDGDIIRLGRTGKITVHLHPGRHHE